jgi:3-hydroxyisobutyrate dehydrogenase-like beta-hydroxyacid dehydrogenase
MATVAFIGLGVMGYPMAGYLKTKGGHDVRVYNRTAAKARNGPMSLAAPPATLPPRLPRAPISSSPASAMMMTCAPSRLARTAFLSGMKNGAILIDNTTASAEVARELAEACAAKGCGFLDAPVSGGQAGADNGVLTVMVGGDEATFEKASPVIDAYARMVGLMGPVGSGQLTKMINQICIAGLVQGLAEGIHFGKKAGLDIEKVVDVISKGAAGSWQMENRHKTMNAGKYDYGFAVDWMRKDLDIVLNEAKRNGATLPVTALVDQFYADVQAMGGNRWDTSSLLARLEK